MYGLKQDWVDEPAPRHFVLQDYEGAVPRWCPGCGDHAVLGAVQRLVRDEQLAPENLVMVSGIGCSSRFPHYMKTYGFHGLHGRPLPVACGVRSRRPDLDIFVVTGDGDCCAIGTAHWIHALRYNMRMVVLMLDNSIYGLTKMQSSPTTPKLLKSNTHPAGSPLPPLNPLSVTLAVTNVSFVAQTVDWNPAHIHAVLEQAYHHPGLAFIRIRQRCPHYLPGFFDPIQRDPASTLLLTHDEGIGLDASVSKIFKNQLQHDPNDLAAAHELALRDDVVPIGLLYRNKNAERYDELSAAGHDFSSQKKLEALEAELDRFVI